jgi:hypothetical protein
LHIHVHIRISTKFNRFWLEISAIAKADYYAKIAKDAIVKADASAEIAKSAIEDANETAQVAKNAIEDANKTAQITDVIVVVVNILSSFCILNNQDIIADKNINKVDSFSSVFAKVITTIAFITCAGNFI